MNIITLPKELLVHIIGNLSSRQDFVNLQSTCKILQDLFLDHQEHQRRTHLAELPAKKSLEGTYTIAKSWVRSQARIIASPCSMIQAYLIVYLPSEHEASITLYSILWARRYKIEFETFVLETLYGYMNHEHFLQDKNGAQKLRRLYVKDRRLSSLSLLRCEEDRFCRSQEHCSGVSKRAFEVCREYKKLDQRDHALHLAQYLLDGLLAEFGRCAPSTRHWAEYVSRLRGQPTKTGCEERP